MAIKWDNEDSIELNKTYLLHLDTRSNYTTWRQFDDQIREQFGEDTLAEIEVTVKEVY